MGDLPAAAFAWQEGRPIEVRWANIAGERNYVRALVVRWDGSNADEESEG